MPLPEIVPVKYTEEEAEYLSLRPVVRQSFRIGELLDMILAVTGKDTARVQQILRSGTTVFHFYRYWWQGFDADEAELARLLAQFPDPQPSRAFRPEECSAVELHSAAGRPALRLEKAQAARRRWLARHTVWDDLLEAAGHAQAAGAVSSPPRYHSYSYDRKADRYALDLTPDQWAALRSTLTRRAPRRLRATLAALPIISRIDYFCPRR